MNIGAKLQTDATTPALAASELLRVEGLKKYFSVRGREGALVRAVDDVSFTIASHETLSLVGESGCGKTTTARAIVRATDPTAGRVLFRAPDRGQIDLATLPKRELRALRPHLQMVFQDPYSALNPRLCVRDIVGEPLVIHGLDRREVDRRVADLLARVGLRPAYMSRYPNAFSGGQRQRIAIARALALSPRLVVLDEAVSALDVSVQAQILNLLMDLQEEADLSYLFVSHDLSVVKSISDRVGVMYVGRLVELGPNEELFRRPLHPYTAALLCAVPRPDPKQRDKVRVAPGETASPRNPPSGCHFHPRCPFAVDRCRSETPAWEEVSPARFTRCHRARELELDGVAR
ncbi:ABC transporter ATP-binding protein [Terricaulis sp.]|uniref:ABC transporter ATP-binding protein n=1 Tax=Terricaulis sp. TaxID=2768686 RepID=UPI0037834681